MRKTCRIGDVLEIRADSGYAHAQITHDVPQWGQLLRVLRGMHQQHQGDAATLAAEPLLFWQLFPARQAVRSKIMTIVGEAPIPFEARAFPLFRAEGGTTRTGEVLNWWLWDGKIERPVGALTEALAEMPVRDIVNDTELIRRIELFHGGFSPASLR